MASEKDTYKTIRNPSEEVLYKEKDSKFYGYAFPVTSEEQIKEQLELLKQQHHTARHWCYAWQLGMRYDRYRANDDGEPSNSAGMPIYGQLQSFDVTNVLVVVVRYFGGTKLGVGGLIQAYKTAAQLALEAAPIVKRTINVDFVLTFEYPEMSMVMRMIKEAKLKIVSQALTIGCKIQISVREKEADRIYSLFTNTYKVNIKKLEN
ncbi:IMPACT family protein [Candidatus Ulvibacter alkanivorans]|uniref:IMPACT family protein n=1 Tax=Candidatus Ulvibacter alkanivorans TaxID=2267620 RepID=UPI000DF422D1|nr:YigZ family protein [Candidatus Ulvibacter alkanivorans]